MDPVNGDIRMQDNNMVLYENGAVSVTELPMAVFYLGQEHASGRTQKQHGQATSMGWGAR